MTDFLSRIVSRALGGSDRLAPRLPSLHEMSTGTTGSADAADLAAAAPVPPPRRRQPSGGEPAIPERQRDTFRPLAAATIATSPSPVARSVPNALDARRDAPDVRPAAARGAEPAADRVRRSGALRGPQPVRAGALVPAVKEHVRPSQPAPRGGRSTADTPQPHGPVIRVTIGRVEVRAVPAPQAPPAASPSRRPGVSLADYRHMRRSRSQ